MALVDALTRFLPIWTSASHWLSDIASHLDTFSHPKQTPPLPTNHTCCHLWRGDLPATLSPSPFPLSYPWLSPSESRTCTHSQVHHGAGVICPIPGTLKASDANDNMVVSSITICWIDVRSVRNKTHILNYLFTCENVTLIPDLNMATEYEIYQFKLTVPYWLLFF